MALIGRDRAKRTDFDGSALGFGTLVTPDKKAAAETGKNYCCTEGSGHDVDLACQSHTARNKVACRSTGSSQIAATNSAAR